MEVRAFAGQSIFVRDAVRATGDRGARLPTFELGERSCYPLPIPFPLLIGRRLRLGTGHHVQDAQPRQRVRR
jgi:hypothetical protein